VSPEQIGAVPPTRTIGGPPSWHLAGGVGDATQLPPAHAVVGPHAWPQVPQFWLSVAVFTHEPLHAVRPPAQLVEHVPLRHTLPGSQAMLQPPQFAGSPDVGMHLPPQNDW
jgi:hypothetical protein